MAWILSSLHGEGTAIDYCGGAIFVHGANADAAAAVFAGRHGLFGEDVVFPANAAVIAFDEFFTGHGGAVMTTAACGRPIVMGSS
jgi:hypothetical protein